MILDIYMLIEYYTQNTINGQSKKQVWHLGNVQVGFVTPFSDSIY